MLTAVVAVLVAMVAACTPAQVLTGTVTDEASAVVAAAQVRVHILWGPVVGTATTDGAGRYQIDSLPPDRYRIEVIPPAGYETAWHPASATDVDGAVVELTAGASVDADVVVPATPPPLRLGTPGNAFGNQVTSDCPQAQPQPAAPCGPQPMIWAGINGPYTTYLNGDPYATKCTATNTGQSNRSYCDNGGAPQNPLYRPTGYAYAVDVAPQDIGTPLTVEVYDATSTQRTAQRTQASGSDCNGGSAPFNAAPYAGTSWTNQHCQTGDTGGTWNPVLKNVSTPGYNVNELNMQFSLFRPSASGTTIAYDELQRSSTGGDCRLRTLAGINAATAGYKNAWKAVCTFVPAHAGIHALRVQSSGIEGVADDGDAFNGFALRVTGGTTTGLRPLDDISTWSNVVTAPTAMYLADVGSAAAGKTLIVDLFDLGDAIGAGANTVQLLAPPAGVPGIAPTGGTPVACSYNAVSTLAPPPSTPDQSPSCTVQTKAPSASSGLYNGGWLRLSVPIPGDYSCTTDCWWSLRLDNGGNAITTERSVWTVHLA